MMHALLFFCSLALGILLTLFSTYPAFSFVLYEAVYFFTPTYRWWNYYVPSASYSFYTVLLMIFALFLKYVRHHKPNKIGSAPQYKWLILLLILYSVAWLYAVNPERHLVAATNFFKLFIIVTVAYKLVDTCRQFDFMIWGYLFGGWYISFLTYQTGRNLRDRVEGIGTVDSPDSNGIAAAIAPCIVLSFYYFFVSKPKLGKLLFAIAGVFVANAIVLINSRGAMLAVATSMTYFMYFIYFAPLQKKFQKVSAIFVTIAGLAGTAYLIDDVFVNRFSTMSNIEVNREAESGATRMLFWLAAIDMSWDYPFGQGYHGFDYHAPKYLPEDLHTGSHRNRSVHSTWFEALSEIGYPGLIVFIALIGSCFLATRKCKEQLISAKDYEGYFKIVAIEAALIAFIVAMSFLNRIRAEVLYWLIMYTMCAYNIYIIKNDPVNKQ